MESLISLVITNYQEHKFKKRSLMKVFSEHIGSIDFQNEWRWLEASPGLEEACCIHLTI